MTPSSGKHTTKKNSMVIRKKGSQRFIGQNNTCKVAQLDLHMQAKLHGPLIFGPLIFDLEFIFPIPAGKKNLAPGMPRIEKPDGLNLAALVMDACQGAIYADDAQICDGRVRKTWGLRCEILCTLRRWADG